MSIIDKIHADYIQPRKMKNIKDNSSKKSYLSGVLPDFYIENYFSPFNLIWLHQLNSNDIFQNDLVFLVRDGLIEMVRFFVQNPSPSKSHKAMILFPKEFSHFIPLAWKKVSCSYSFFEKKNIFFGTSENILVTGHLTPETFDENKFKKVLDELAKKIKIFFYF